jgi:hypothetical protein
MGGSGGEGAHAETSIAAVENREMAESENTNTGTQHSKDDLPAPGRGAKKEGEETPCK